jgi:hypothetical protein
MQKQSIRIKILIFNIFNLNNLTKFYIYLFKLKSLTAFINIKNIL